MAERVLTYERLGPDASHGFKFEISTTGLAYLRCEKLYKQYLSTKMSGVKSFFVANNVKHIGAFDDVVIRVEYLEGNEIRTKLIFVQCKHLADVASTSDKKYMEYLNKKASIQKYFNSFLSIYQILQTNLCTEENNHLRNFLNCKFEDCDFVFYSNIDLQHVTNLDMFELVPQSSKKDITENLLVTTKTDFLRLKVGESKNLICLPEFEFLKTVFCKNFKIILNQKENSGKVLTEEIRLFLKIGMKMKSVCNVFKEEIESHFNSSTSCVALSEDSNLVEKSIAYDMLKCKSVETISQFQKNSSFDALFSKEIIQNLQGKFSNNLDNPLVVTTNFKDLEKRKLVQIFLNSSDFMFLNDVTDMESWHLARQMIIYTKVEAVMICSEVDFKPTIKNNTKINEKLVQIIFNKIDNVTLPCTDEFSDETKALICSKKVDFQGHLQELASICGNKINFLFDEKIICELLEESSTLKICDSLEEPKFYINRQFREKTLKHANIVQKYSIEESLKENFKLLLFSENNKCIPNVVNSFVLFENLEQARNFLRSVPEKANDTIHLCGRGEGLIYTFGKYSKLENHIIISENDLIAGQTKMSKIIILTDIAGMGKSTTLKFFANKYKEKYPSYWVFFIELNKYIDKLKENEEWSDIRFVVKFVSTKMINLKDHECRAFQNACIKTGNVVLFFDAFDEISPDAEKNFLLLLEALGGTKIFCQFVSSRPNYARRLEQHFCQNSIEFVPLENDEIEKFFYVQWKSTLLKDAMNTEKNEVKIKFYIGIFLENIRQSISDELFKIPMHMKMIAELFYEKFTFFLLKKDSDEHSNVDMYTLYNDFCNLLAKRYCIEKEGMDWNKKKENDKKIAINKELAGIEKIACKITCSEFDISDDEDMKHVKTIMCDHLGLLTHINPPRFSHRSYGEFLAAKCIVKQLCTQNIEIIVKFMSILFDAILVYDEYDVLRKFIDSAYLHHKIVNNFDYARVQMPGENNGFGIEALMIAIKEYNLEIMKFIFLCNPIVVNATFGYEGKTPLMLSFEEDKTDVATYILTRKECIVNIVDWCGRSALHYAIRTNKIQLMKLLIEHDPTLLNKQDFYAYTALHAACKLDKYEAAKHLLMYSNCLVNIEDSMSKLAIHYAVQSGNIEIIKLLLTRDHKMLEVHDVLAETLLHAAVQHKKIEVVEFLIKECKCLINVVDWYKRTALHYAVIYGNINIFKFLIKQDQSLVNRQDCHGITALHMACELRKNEEVEYLLLYTDCKINVKDIFLKNAMHYLTENIFDVSIETINLLLERDITLLNDQDIDGNTALHIASYGINSQLVKHLFSNRWQLDHTLLNMQNGTGMTPLHIACKSARKDTMHSLISLPDCNVNVVDSKGKYAIHYAAWSDNASSVSRLLKKDITLLNKQDFEGNTPLDIACRNIRGKVAIVLLSQLDCVVNLKNMLTFLRSSHYCNNRDSVDVVKLILCQNYSLLNKQSEDGTTPLLYACKNGEAKFAELLLSHPDCEVNFEDTAKRNSLHYMAEYGFIEVMKIILGRDRTLLNKQDRNGMTPLHIACKERKNEAANLKIEAANFLLSYENCSVYIQDEEKKFAIHYAAENSSEIFLNLLLNRDLTLLNKQDINGMTPLHIACNEKKKEAAKFLLSYKDCSVHLQDQTNKCAIHYAAETKSFVEILQHMVKRDHTLLNKQDKNGMTPLHIACKEGNDEAANFLLSYDDCSVHLQDEEKRFSIHYAAQYSMVEILKHMLERDHTLLNKKDENDMTPLHFSCNHNGGATKFLLSLTECDVSTLDKRNRSALHYAIEELDIEVLKLILERDFSLLNKQDIDGNTPLHLTCKSACKSEYSLYLKTKVVKYLLSLSDCLINVENIMKQTPLDIEYNSFKQCLNMRIVKLFLERDNTQEIKIDTLMDIKFEEENLEIYTNSISHKYFKTDLKDDNDNTFFHGIANFNYDGTYLMNILLERNPQLLNMQNKNCQTALHIAAKKNNYDVLNFLLNLTDCNVCVKDENGDTALHIYVNQFENDHEFFKFGNHWEHRTETLYDFFSPIKQFIRRDRSLLNMQSNSGQTPLHMAVQKGISIIVRYLIYLGADTDIKDKNENTPLDLARQLQDLSIKHRIVNYLQNK